MNNSFSLSLILSLVGATVGAAPAAAQLAWTEKRPAVAPQARFGHSMSRAHPSFHDYLFGGRDQSGAFGDTWSWNGTTWTLRATTGPSPRYDHALADYHFEDDSLLAFGGRATNGSLLGDTWIWNGSHWIALAPAQAPSARAGHAMTNDVFAIKTVLLFGGRTAQGLSNETWLFVNGQWTRVPTVGGPSPREGHALIRSNEPYRYLLVGGRDETGPLADVWEFDGTAWSQVDALPAPQADAAVVTDDFWRGRPLSFGGDPVSATNATLERLDSGIWVSHDTVGAPSVRTDAAISVDFGFDHALFVLFGGRDPNGNALGDTWKLEPLVLPGSTLAGQGCGPGAWSPNGGPDLFASLPLLGSTLEVTAYTPAPSFGAFVIGAELPPSTSCGLHVQPTLVVPVPVVELFPGLANAKLNAIIPYVPAFSGLEASLQALILQPGTAGAISFSKTLRLKLAE